MRYNVVLQLQHFPSHSQFSLRKTLKYLVLVILKREIPEISLSAMPVVACFNFNPPIRKLK